MTPTSSLGFQGDSVNIKEIRELLQLIEKSAIEEFEMERSGVRIRVRKTAGNTSKPLSVVAKPFQNNATETVIEMPEAGAKEELYIFKAPIVGTVYLNPKPDEGPFVRVGDHVEKGTVLCIIEAMKLFNQIECDLEGTIVQVLVENGQPVEYGEPLFEIRPTS